MDLLFQPGQTVVFAGDSITDAACTLGRGQVGDLVLGEGYVRDVVGLIAARYPEHGLRVHNSAHGGITTENLVELWDGRVLAHEPDWVTVMIGINDCNLTVAESERGVPPARYERNYRDVLGRTRDAGARLVLLDPFYMWPADQPGELPQRTLKLLAEYHAIVHCLVEEFATVHVRTHEIFQRQLANRPLAEIGIEPVHPTPTGHLVIAHALLAALSW